MKKAFLFLIFCCSPLFGTEFPTVIDFKNYAFQKSLLYDDPKSWTWQIANSGYDLGYAGFDDSPQVGAFIHMLKRTYQIPTVVETGTLIGSTALFFSLHFDEVHTVEESKAMFDKAKERLKEHANIRCHLGSSQVVLNTLLPTLKDKPILFYLNAHQNGTHERPVFDELQMISNTHKDNCVIVINNVQVPHQAGQHELSHALIHGELNRIFSGYDFYYLIPISHAHPAKLVVVPKRWANKSYAGRVDILPGQNFYDLPINLQRVKNAGFALRESHQFFNGHDRGDYIEEIRDDSDLKKIIVLNNTVDPMYLVRFPKEKLVLFALEPIDLSSYYAPCSRVYTWDDNLVDNVKFFKLYYPYLVPMLPKLPPFEEKKLCVMVSGSDNCYPERPNELYSERMKMVEFFETKPIGDFDIYGRYWVKRYYRDFRGSIPGDLAGKEKIETLKNYRFAICFENTKGLNGYITEKIFSCFAAGCVPIYWGAENIAEYIPKDCFIDYREFADREELYQFMKSMTKSTYEQYLERISQFLDSEQGYFFTPDYFGELIYQAVTNLSE